MVRRKEGITVSELRKALETLPDHALVFSGERVVTGARVGFGYDKIDKDAPTLIIQLSEPTQQQ